MALEAGFPFTIAVDDSAGSPQTLSAVINNLAYSTPRAVQDVTSVSMSAIARLLLLADMNVTLNLAAFDDAANSTHAVFKTVSSTSVLRTTTLTLSGQVLAAEIYYTDYAISRPADGSLTASIPGVLGNGSVPTWA
jgi:hypothetical protein